MGRWELSFSRLSWASEHLVMSCVVIVTESSSLLSAVASASAQGSEASSLLEQRRPGRQGRRGSKPRLV